MVQRGHGALPQGLAVVDELGVYRIVHSNAAVKADLGLASPVIGRLETGATVVVLELVPLPQEHRLRARLAEPPGWMTLRETRTDYRWATLVRPISAERALLISEVVDRENQLLKLQVRAERLRAEHQTHLNDFRDRVEELEGKLLSAQLVPVDAPERPRQQPRDYKTIRPMHLEGDRELQAGLPQPPSWPEGFRVVDSQEVELDAEMRRALAVHPRPPPPPPHERSHHQHGNIVTSNAWVMPSVNYSGMRPASVYPITRPAGLSLDGGLGDQVYAPLPTPDHYDSDYPGAWRFSAAGGCPLAVQRVDMVEDVYGRSRHLRPSPVYAAVAAQQ